MRCLYISQSAIRHSIALQTHQFVITANPTVMKPLKEQSAPHARHCLKVKHGQLLALQKARQWQRAKFERNNWTRYDNI